MKRILNSKWGLLLLVAVLCSCEKGTVYHSYQSFDSEGWKRNAEITFRPDTIKETALYRIDIELRNHSDYPFADLWLTISHNCGDSTQVTSDTLHCTLANAKGDFLGKGLGDIYEKSFPYKTLLIKKNECPVFHIKHIMKYHYLYGLSDIGIKIVRDGQSQFSGK